jgi:hypothetical protein
MPTKPQDIPQATWDALPEELQMWFDFEFNHDAAMPQIRQFDQKARALRELRNRINANGNILREKAKQAAVSVPPQALPLVTPTIIRQKQAAEVSGVLIFAALDEAIAEAQKLLAATEAMINANSSD